MGDGRIFLETRRDASFNKIYRMSLISTGSISLDSTFKKNNLPFVWGSCWFPRYLCQTADPGSPEDDRSYMWG